MTDSNDSRNHRVREERASEHRSRSEDRPIVIPAAAEQNDGVLAMRKSTVDVDTAERMKQALKATGVPALLALDITVGNGSIVINGNVPSYYAKQLAQAILLPIRGTHEIRNESQVILPQEKSN
jgi:hypothetical protein